MLVEVVWSSAWQVGMKIVESYHCIEHSALLQKAIYRTVFHASLRVYAVVQGRAKVEGAIA